MKAACHVKHLGVDKQLLETLLPPHVSAPLIKHICSQGHWTPGCPCPRSGQCSEKQHSKQQCFPEKTSPFFWSNTWPLSDCSWCDLLLLLDYHHLTWPLNRFYWLGSEKCFFLSYSDDKRLTFLFHKYVFKCVIGATGWSLIWVQVPDPENTFAVLFLVWLTSSRFNYVSQPFFFYSLSLLIAA